MKSSDLLRKKKNYAALYSLAGVGWQAFQKILFTLKKHKISFEEFWVGGESFWTELLINKRIVNSIQNFNKEYTIDSYYDCLMGKSIRVIIEEEEVYPPLLKEAKAKPPVLLVKAKDVDNLQMLHSDCPIAVVGTRHHTPYGESATRKLVAEMVELGATVVSGFMYGIDTLSHQVAIENGGQTIGVVGYGFDHIYPSTHRKLFQQLLDQGMIFISEYAPWVQPRAGNFVRRNYLIAGMSWGVVVIEAAGQSGSHITAQHALDEGGSVYAVPGSIFSVYSEGTKWLINQGAKLVSSGGEVLSDLHHQNDYAPPASSTIEKTIYGMLTTQPMAADALYERLLHQEQTSHTTLAEMNQALSVMELNGSIMRSGLYYEVTQ